MKQRMKCSKSAGYGPLKLLVSPLHGYSIRNEAWRKNLSDYNQVLPDSEARGGLLCSGEGSQAFAPGSVYLSRAAAELQHPPEAVQISTTALPHTTRFFLLIIFGSKAEVSPGQELNGNHAASGSLGPALFIPSEALIRLITVSARKHPSELLILSKLTKRRKKEARQKYLTSTAWCGAGGQAMRRASAPSRRFKANHEQTRAQDFCTTFGWSTFRHFGACRSKTFIYFY